MSIAWAVSNKNVSTVILGASRVEQLEETLKVIEFESKITPEVKEKIDAIVQFVPKLPELNPLALALTRYLLNNPNIKGIRCPPGSLPFLPRASQVPSASLAQVPSKLVMAPNSSTPATKMTHRFLGDSDLLVSKLALGSWMAYNEKYTVDGWFEMVKLAYEHGVNFYDTAEVYGNGQAEELLGGAIKKGIAEGLWSREDLVISTKVFSGTKGFTESGPNDQGNSRKHIVEGIKASLKRLDLEYVDVVFSHRPEPYTPTEETVRAMNFVINQGWAFYWGTSEWLASDIREACEIADRLGLIRPIVEQAQYNIFVRNKVEYEFVDLYKKYKLGLTTWSPLAFGTLTGKYSDGKPEGSRYTGGHVQGRRPIR
ncbi:unnamed protein product [Phytophthora fragariaefolia]|uniref:Unnamed protein product n=1 Tax=Phytophthora fragariaefolia TaxID=1490495 RepID=A0A9W6XHB8_9STRA|nr:unnamed protein product [Phytophthora fragariaefolia]